MKTLRAGDEWAELRRRSVAACEALRNIWSSVDAIALPSALHEIARDATLRIERACQVETADYVETILIAEDVVEAIRIWVTEPRPDATRSVAERPR